MFTVYIYVFDFIGGSWNQANKLTTTDGTTYDRFGISVSLSNNRALIGADYDGLMTEVFAFQRYKAGSGHRRRSSACIITLNLIDE